MSTVGYTTLSTLKPVQTPPEEWRVIPEHPGYRVSNLGHVQSRRRRGQTGGHDEVWRDSKVGRTNHGHLMIRMSYGGKAVRLYIHRLVLELFVGPCPPGMEGCHNDDNPANNCITNLRWDTHSNNMKECSQKGRMARGRTNGIVKLTLENVYEIKRLVAGGMLHREVATRFGICKQAVSNIVRGKRWAGQCE